MEKKLKETERVRNWLEMEVGLKGYDANFIENGYDSLDIIKAISNKQELSEIDIHIEEHQNKIMMEIDKLLIHDDIIDVQNTVHNVTIGENDTDDIGEINECVEGMQFVMDGHGAKEVKAWLDSIGFGSYVDLFTKNGFDSLEMVKEIKSKHDLNDIGVTIKAHQLKFMNHIQKLKKHTTVDRS
eukprot:881079_1